MSQTSEELEKRKLPELGLHDDIAENDYFASPGISKHGLDLINQSGAHYKEKKIEETKALIYGGAFHMMVLEPDKFDSRYVVNDMFDSFRSNDAKAWRQAENDAGRRVISIKEHNHMIAMHKTIRDHEYASILLDSESGKAEASAYWIDKDKSIWNGLDPTYRLCRCRPDFINEAHSVVIDLKTTICAGYSLFGKQCANFRYHVQASFYLDGLRNIGVKVKKFIFVAIEKEPPYSIGIYYLDVRAMQLGRQIYQQDMLKYHDFMDKEEWPSYEPHVRTLELPKYAEYVDYY